MVTEALARSKLRAGAIVILVMALAGGGVANLGYGSNPLTGVLGGAALGALHSLYQHFFFERLRRLPFALVLAINTCAYTVIAAVALNVGMFTFGIAAHPVPLSLQTLRIYWWELAWWIDFAFMVPAAAAISTVIAINALIGPSVLWQFLLGRYHRPRHEERVFMFLDLVGSTAIAERLGDLEFHALLQRIAADLSAIILNHQGQIDRYLGDGVIVTWPLAKAVKDLSCLKCCQAIKERLAATETEYEERFGERPAFRAGLHAGPVVVGEIGVHKKEILFLGDTVNTTARLEQACREYGRNLLISGDLLSKLEMPSDWKVEPLQSFKPRGRATELSVYAVALPDGSSLL